MLFLWFWFYFDLTVLKSGCNKPVKTEKTCKTYPKVEVCSILEDCYFYFLKKKTQKKIILGS